MSRKVCAWANTLMPRSPWIIAAVAFALALLVLGLFGRRAMEQTAEPEPLEQTAGRLWMRIEDNGRGITEQELADPKSLGLAGMRERAMGLGGEFTIRGVPGRGTVARVSFPLSKS